MSLSGRVRKWWYWQQMAKIDRHCAKHGHLDSGCWSESGAMGVKCGHCGRIIWTERDGEVRIRYQAPSRASEGNWR